jgi:hypothetical protein
VSLDLAEHAEIPEPVDGDEQSAEVLAVRFLHVADERDEPQDG